LKKRLESFVKELGSEFRNLPGKTKKEYFRPPGQCEAEAVQQ
jgi:hypothetical protein